MCFVSFSTAAGSSNLLPTRELVVSQSIISVWMCEHVLLEQKGKVVNALLYVNTVVLLTVIVLVVLHLETKSSLKIHFLSPASSMVSLLFIRWIARFTFRTAYP